MHHLLLSSSFHVSFRISSLVEIVVVDVVIEDSLITEDVEKTLVSTRIGFCNNSF